MTGAYEVLVGVLSNVPGEQREFNYDSERFHSFFFLNQGKYKILEQIQFEKGAFTHSNELDEAFSNLLAHDSVTFFSGTFNPYFIRDPCDIAYNDFVKPLLKRKEISEIESLSNEFTKEFCIESVLN